MLKRTITVSLFFFTLFSVQNKAQTVFAKYAGEFMSIGVGGRALGMGGAFTAVANDVTAGYYNPAGLATLNYPQITLMHAEQFGSLVNYDYAAVAFPWGSDMTFGLSAIRLGVDGINDTRNALIDKNTGEVISDINNPAAGIDPNKVTQFNNADWVFYLSFAKREAENFYYGANVKIIRRDLAEYGATGIGFDIGAVYSIFKNLYLGANIQDVTTTLIAWNTGRNELVTPTAKIGAAYIFEFLGGTFTPAVDFDFRFENRRYSANFNVGPISLDPHLGLEYNFKDIFAVRGGYNDVKQFTIGAGVKLPKLNIDYSFAKFSGSVDETLPESHRISIILTLEQPRFLRNSN